MCARLAGDGWTLMSWGRMFSRVFLRSEQLRGRAREGGSAVFAWDVQLRRWSCTPVTMRRPSRDPLDRSATLASAAPLSCNERTTTAPLPLHEIRDLLEHANLSQTDTDLNAVWASLHASMTRYEDFRCKNSCEQS